MADNDAKQLCFDSSPTFVEGMIPQVTERRLQLNTELPRQPTELLYTATEMNTALLINLVSILLLPSHPLSTG